MAPKTLDHVVRHDEYYLQGGDLFFLVENTFFSIHSYFFIRDSPTFGEELTAPLEPGKRRKGSEESNAIQIRNATPQEFANFLWVFYNETFGLYRATVEKWTSILKIACAHDFPGVKDFAVRGLELCDIPIADRIKLYHVFDVDESYLTAWFVKFCRRDEGPTDGETEIMGMKVSLFIFRARERFRAASTSPTGPEQTALAIVSSMLNVGSGPTGGPNVVVNNQLVDNKKKPKANNGDPAASKKPLAGSGLAGPGNPPNGAGSSSKTNERISLMAPISSQAATPPKRSTSLKDKMKNIFNLGNNRG